MSVKRVLIAIDEMEIGGSQRQIANLLAGLDRTRWQPELLYFRNESFLLDSIRANGVVIHRLPKRGKIDVRFMLALIRLLRERRYAIVHAYSLTAELWLRIALIFLARSAPPMIASIRGLYESQSRIFWRLKTFVLRGSTAIISNSIAGVDVASSKCHMQPFLFDVVGNGLAPAPPLLPARRDALRREIGVSDGRPCGIFVGRLVEQKNVPCLLDALAMLPISARPLLAIVGDGPLLLPLTQQSTKLGLNDDVRWLGERADAVALMQSVDFMVLPSHSEGLSNVLLEAMSVGCPVIASSVGGNLEVIEHEKTGLLFPCGDRQALRDALNRMVTDSALREVLAVAARRRVERDHSITALVTHTQHVYERCLCRPTAEQAQMTWTDAPDQEQH